MTTIIKELKLRQKLTDWFSNPYVLMYIQSSEMGADHRNIRRYCRNQLETVSWAHSGVVAAPIYRTSPNILGYQERYVSYFAFESSEDALFLKLKFPNGKQVHMWPAEEGFFTIHYKKIID